MVVVDVVVEVVVDVVVVVVDVMVVVVVEVVVEVVLVVLVDDEGVTVTLMGSGVVSHSGGIVIEGKFGSVKSKKGWLL